MAMAPPLGDGTTLLGNASPISFDDYWLPICAKVTSSSPTEPEERHLSIFIDSLRHGGKLKNVGSPIGGIFHHLASRMLDTDGIVVLKSQTVFHYLFRNDDAFARLVAAEKSSLFALPAHQDTDSKPYAAFAKSYGKYLQQWLAMKNCVNFPPGRMREDDPATVQFYCNNPISAVIEAVSAMFDTLQTMFTIQFDEDVKNLPAAATSFRLLLMEFSLLWDLARKGLNRVLERFSSLDKPIAESGLSMYSRYVQLVPRAEQFVSIANPLYNEWEAPDLQPIPLEMYGKLRGCVGKRVSEPAAGSSSTAPPLATEEFSCSDITPNGVPDPNESIQLPAFSGGERENAAALGWIGGERGISVFPSFRPVRRRRGQDLWEKTKAVMLDDPCKALCVRATCHDNAAPRRKYVMQIVDQLQIRSSTGVPANNGGIISCHLMRRMMKKDWIVVVKAQMVFHYCFRSGNGGFVEYIAKTLRHNFSSYPARLKGVKEKDSTASDGGNGSFIGKRQYIPFVKSYGNYLESWLTMKAITKFPNGSSVDYGLGIATFFDDVPANVLMSALPYLMSTIEDLIKLPLSAMRTTGVTQPAYVMLLHDMTDLWTTLSRGILSLLNMYFTLPQTKAGLAKGLYMRYIRTVDIVQPFFEVARTEEWWAIPESNVSMEMDSSMQEYIDCFSIQSPATRDALVPHSSDEVQPDNGHIPALI